MGGATRGDAANRRPVSPIRSLLVANRGEIALRILRTAEHLGLRTVAVASEADRDALHVHAADRAVVLGPAPAEESYLSIERILGAAREAGADAVHPGYGFLSENPAFARACAEAGLVFVGPPAGAIELMGNKAAAKRRMVEAGVPCVPGYQGEGQGDEALLRAAEEIGWPVMVKAAAGGGGRGMRRVAGAEELPDGLARARSEARNAFGSDELILEKALERPRHVEIQVFADDHGTVLHLGERDCSTQRRHQKVIEEAPCPVMTDDLREAMGAAAVEAARSIGYRGAGTVEFLLDENGSFYFLEMNTRLQVEHPVTEEITGLDLVELQLRVAEGRPLGIAQEDVELKGHAIEARLYAEDPAHDFLPQSGPVHCFDPAGDPESPASHPESKVRIDAGIRSGQEVSPHYDPMIAKVIAHGSTRDEARRRLADALRDTAIFGLTTNRDFLVACLEHPVFVAGEVTTAFLDEAAGELRQPATDRIDAAVSAVAEHRAACEEALAESLLTSRALLDWSNGTAAASSVRYSVQGDLLDLDVAPLGADRYRLTARATGTDPEGTTEAMEIEVLHRRPAPSPAAPSPADGGAPSALRLDVLLRFLPEDDGGDGASNRAAQSTLALRALAHREDSVLHLSTARVGESGDPVLHSGVFTNLFAGAGGTDPVAADGALTAPMHGLIQEIRVEEGVAVTAGQLVVVLEAMKMQHEITAPMEGSVARIAVSQGQQVAAGDVLLEIDASSSETATDPQETP